MALTLKTAISADQTTIDVEGTDTLREGSYRTLGDETVMIRTARVQGLQPGETAWQRLSVDRGIENTEAVAHDAAVTMAAYSGGGGGGVTNPLLEPFSITPTEGGIGFEVKDENGFSVLQVGNTENLLPVLVRGPGTPEDGFIIFSVETVGFVELFTVHSDGFTEMGFPTAFPWGGLQLKFETTHESRPFQMRLDSLNRVVFAVTKVGHAIIAANAAPADGDIAANEMAIWFDSTNGAAKLMVKAKTADGTVVTGNVALA